MELTATGVAQANDRVEAFALGQGVEPALALRLRMVVEELGLNVVKYGGPDLTRLELSLVTTGEGIALTLRDDGVPFDPTVPAPPPCPDSLDDASIGGLGLVMVRKAATSMDYAREDGRNRVRVLL